MRGGWSGSRLSRLCFARRISEGPRKVKFAIGGRAAGSGRMSSHRRVRRARLRTSSKSAGADFAPLLARFHPLGYNGVSPSRIRHPFSVGFESADRALLLENAAFIGYNQRRRRASGFEGGSRVQAAQAGKECARSVRAPAPKLLDFPTLPLRRVAGSLGQTMTDRWSSRTTQHPVHDADVGMNRCDVASSLRDKPSTWKETRTECQIPMSSAASALGGTPLS